MVVVVGVEMMNQGQVGYLAKVVALECRVLGCLALTLVLVRRRQSLLPGLRSWQQAAAALVAADSDLKGALALVLA